MLKTYSLGPISLHFGSVLISEGTSDIMFAIQNAGNITAKSYFTHKFWSLLISIACAGIGAYLSRGATVGKELVINTAGQEITTTLIYQASKEGSRVMAKAIFKKIVGEITRSLLGLVQSLVTNYFG